MKTFEETISLLNELYKAMSKFAVVERQPMNFGVGIALCSSEIHTLDAVDKHDGVGVTELAEELEITKGAVSQTISKLESKQLLTKEQDPLHRSRVIIRVTPLGSVACKNHVAFHKEHDKHFVKYVASLDDCSFAQCSEFCRQMNKWMDTYLK